MAQVPALIPPLVPMLVQADGKTPMASAAELRSEIAGPSVSGVRSIQSGHPADNLSPQRLAALLRQAEDGQDPERYLELAEAMEERDLHYLSVLGTRKRAVAQLPIQVKAASDSPIDQRNADLVRTFIERDTLENELFDILDAVGKGFSVTEIVWSLGARQWTPERLVTRDARWFGFDRMDGTTPLLRGDGGQLEPLKRNKFIVHLHPAKTGLPIRSGLARPVAWAYLFKTFTLKDWAIFSEIYGMPFRVGKYGPEATEEQKRTLLRAVADIGTDAAAIIPASMSIEFVAAATGAGGDLFERRAEYLDKQISKAVLGQTATTDSEGGGLGGSGKEHNDVRGDIERADAKMLAATLNRDLVRPTVDLNYGPQAAYPRLIIGREDPVDIAAMTAALSALVPLGLKVGMSTVRDRIGFPDPGTDELLAPPAATAPQTPPKALPAPAAAAIPAATAATRFLGLLTGLGGGIGTAGADGNLPATGKPDLIDEFGARELGDWQAIMNPMLAPIDALLADCSTLEDARDRIATAIETMDPAELTEILARGIFGARLIGVAELAASGAPGN